LSISIWGEDRSLILKGLFYCFPHIEYLTYSSDIISMKILNDVINKPVYLLNTSFYSLNCFCKKGADLYSNKDTNLILKGLFYCFPYTKYLTYPFRISPMKILNDIINEPMNLFNDSFDSGICFCEMGTDLYSNSNPIIQNSQRLNRTHFTYRAKQLKLSETSSFIHTYWWMAPQVNLFLYNKIYYLF